MTHGARARPEEVPVPLDGHIPVLDGIRGLAALLVIWTHIGTVLQPPFTSTIDILVQKAAQSMWLGVDLFFVLSGFLITGILLDSRGSPNYFRAFYIRRALRIFPLYYAFLAVVFLVLPRLGAPMAEPETMRDQWWYWTYLSNVRFALTDHMPYSLGYLWSLAVEEQFYLFWPLVVLVLSRQALARLCIAIVVGLLVARPLLVEAGMTWIQAYALTPTRMDALALGGLIAATARAPGGLARLRRWAPSAGLVSAIIVVGIATYKPLLGLMAGESALSVTRAELPYDLHLQMLRFTFNATMFGALLVIGLMAAPSSAMVRVFGGRVMRMFGRYSYAIYMFHVPLYLLAAHYGLAGEFLPRVGGLQFPRALLFYMMLTIASTAVAFVSWHLFEKHFLKLKSRFSYRSPNARTREAVTEKEREVFASP